MHSLIVDYPVPATQWSLQAERLLTKVSVTGADSVLGKFVGGRFGDLRLSQLRASGHFGVHSTSDADLRSGHFIAALVTHGRVSVTQRGRAQIFGAGQVALYSTTQSFRVGSIRNFGMRFAMIPFDAIGLPPEKILKHAVEHWDEPLNTRVAEAIRSAQRDISQAALDVLTSALTSVGQNIPTRTRTDIGSRDITGDAIALIDESLGSSDLNAARIARALGISVRSLYNHFTLEGHSVAEYIRTRRLEAALIICLDGSVDQVSDVATMAGFQNFSHFSRLFKREFGLSPSQVLSGSVER